MTEEEAKTKWCPFSRVETFDAQGGCSGGNRGGGITSCIGSACMAWRWDHDEPLCVIEGTDLHPELVNTVANAAKYNFKVIRHIEATGHCGLAGKP